MLEVIQTILTAIFIVVFGGAVLILALPLVIIVGALVGAFML